MRQPRGHAALAAFGAFTMWFALIQAITLGTSAFGLPLGRVAAIAALLTATAAAVAFGSWLGIGRWPQERSRDRRRQEPEPVERARRSQDGGAERAPRRSPTDPQPAPPVADVAPAPGGALARVVVAIAVAWAASVWLRLWVLGIRRPPYDWDGLYYHIPALHGWTMRGRVAWIDDVPDVPFVNLPMGAEAHTFFMHQVLGDDRLLTAGNLWFWPLAFLALVVIAGTLGARVPFRCLAGALLAGVPVVVCQSVTAYTDPAFAATVMAALASACVLVVEEQLRPLPRVLLFGAALGLMAGAKGTGAPFALILFAATLAWALFVRGAGAWRPWLARMALAAVVAAAIGGYWYVRNTLHTGNPIHPIQLAFGAKVLAPGYDHVAFSEANLPAWLARVPAALRMPASWLQFDAPVAGYAPVGGLGFVWLVALPAVAWLIWSRVRAWRGAPAGERTPDATLFLATVLIVMLAVQAATWWSRFTIWLHALGLTALALFLQRWFAAPPPARPRAAAVLPALGLVAAITVAAIETERTLAIEWNTGRIHDGGRARYQSTVGRLFPGFAGDPVFARFAAEPVIARSRWGSYGTLLGGVLSLPLGRRSIVVLPPVPTADDIEALRARGISWIVWDERGAGGIPSFLAERTIERRSWRPWPGETFDLLRLAPP